MTKKDRPFIITCFTIVVVSLLVSRFLFQICFVSGDSMYPTLKDGEITGINKIEQEINRFDIVVIKNDDLTDTKNKNINIVKRVIGLPGEIVHITNEGKIFINGQLLDENYGYETIKNPGLAGNGITLADDEYFVLGDNRNASTDSRDSRVGPIKKNDIVGVKI